MTYFRLVLKLVGFAASLFALWTSWRERRAGKHEAVLEQRKTNERALQTANAARARRRERDAGPDGLREDDGFRRD